LAKLKICANLLANEKIKNSLGFFSRQRRDQNDGRGKEGSEWQRRGGWIRMTKKKDWVKITKKEKLA